MFSQGELEHRSPKAWYTRTSRKHFIKQLTKIERRRARLRRIRARHQTAGKLRDEEVPITPEAHHTIGKSQNYPENIPLFLQKYVGDPAVKVKVIFSSADSNILMYWQDFVPKLKNHILPRIKEMILKEVSSDSASDAHVLHGGLLPESLGDTNSQPRDSVLFKNDCMYSHHLARFNYTTYDVRRGQDVVNPGTDHRDIMLLGDMDTQYHPFLYARVLGIYHVNVIYIGEGMLDYKARRVEFLWVRWFEHIGSRSSGWDNFKLDSVRFPPMATEGAFGFVDPRDVLRGCHIIPAFASGKVRVGLSRHVRDAQDWSRYFVGR
jgi:hypothetical protein